MQNDNNTKNKITEIVFNFFVDSHDFNGISLRAISDELEIKYETSIDLIQDLVREEKISIQSSTNPHIIGFQHFLIGTQVGILEEAKNTKVTEEKIGEITYMYENTEFPICLYPSQKTTEIRKRFRPY